MCVKARFLYCGYAPEARREAGIFLSFARASRRRRTWVMASWRFGRGMAPGRRVMTNFRTSAYVIPWTQQRKAITTDTDRPMPARQQTMTRWSERCCSTQLTARSNKRGSASSYSENGILPYNSQLGGSNVYSAATRSSAPIFTGGSLASLIFPTNRVSVIRCMVVSV
jgi:hypothetical protein